MQPNNDRFYWVVEGVAKSKMSQLGREADWRTAAGTMAGLITETSKMIDAKNGSGFTKIHMLMALAEDLEQYEGKEQQDRATVWYEANRAAVIMLREERTVQKKPMKNELEEVIAKVEHSTGEVSAFTRRVLGDVAKVYDTGLSGVYGDTHDSVRPITLGRIE